MTELKKHHSARSMKPTCCYTCVKHSYGNSKQKRASGGSYSPANSTGPSLQGKDLRAHALQTGYPGQKKACHQAEDMQRFSTGPQIICLEVRWWASTAQELAARRHSARCRLLVWHRGSLDWLDIGQDPVLRIISTTVHSSLNNSHHGSWHSSPQQLSYKCSMTFTWNANRGSGARKAWKP